MPTSKLDYLQKLRFKLATGQIQPRDMEGIRVQDTDGRDVALADPDALAVLDRRIAAEGGAPPAGQ